MQKYVLAAVLVLMASGAQATLIDRGDGFISTTMFRISPGRRTRTSTGMIFGRPRWPGRQDTARPIRCMGPFDWRLPTTLQPDASCSTQSDPGGGLPLQGSGYGCTGSEMGHLFNVDGITAYAMGPFTNV